MKTRVISAIIALPLVIIPIFLGGAIFYLVMFIAALIGLFEFNRAFKVINKDFYVMQIVSVIMLYGVMWFKLDSFYFSSGVLLLMMSFMYYVIKYPKSELKEIFYTLIGFYYIPLMLSHIILVRQFETYGSLMVWMIFIISFGSDSFAYFVGRTFGKHKLAKELSPKKTVEGAIGGILGAAALSVVYASYIATTGIEFHMMHYVGFAVMGAVGSIFGQFGDMSASAMKRVTGIKDFGNFLPGHGGIVDRLDSIIFVAPFVYYALLFILKGF